MAATRSTGSALRDLFLILFLTSHLASASSTLCANSSKWIPTAILPEQAGSLSGRTCEELREHLGDKKCEDKISRDKCQDGHSDFPQATSREACEDAGKYWATAPTVQQIVVSVDSVCCGGASSRCGHAQNMCENPNKYRPHGIIPEFQHGGTCQLVASQIEGGCDDKFIPDRCQEAPGKDRLLPKFKTKEACTSAGKHWKEYPTIREVLHTISHECCDGENSRCHTGSVQQEGICKDPSKFHAGTLVPSGGNMIPCQAFDVLIGTKKCHEKVTPDQCIESPDKEGISYNQYQTEQACEHAGKFWKPGPEVGTLVRQLAKPCCSNFESVCEVTANDQTSESPSAMCKNPGKFMADTVPTHQQGRTCTMIARQTAGDCDDIAEKARCQETPDQDEKLLPQYKMHETCAAAGKYWKEAETVGMLLRSLADECCGGTSTRCGSMPSMCLDPYKNKKHGMVKFMGAEIECRAVRPYLTDHCEDKLERDFCQETPYEGAKRLANFTTEKSCHAAGKHWTETKNVEDMLKSMATVCCDGTEPRCSDQESMCLDPSLFVGNAKPKHHDGKTCMEMYAEHGSGKCEDTAIPGKCRKRKRTGGEVLHEFKTEYACASAGHFWSEPVSVEQVLVTSAETCCPGSDTRCGSPVVPMCMDPSKFKFDAVYKMGTHERSCLSFLHWIGNKMCDEKVDPDYCQENEIDRTELPDLKTKKHCLGAGKYWNEASLLVQDVFDTVGHLCCDSTETRCRTVKRNFCEDPAHWDPFAEVNDEHGSQPCEAFAEVIHNAKCDQPFTKPKCQESRTDPTIVPQYFTEEKCANAGKLWVEGPLVGEIMQGVAKTCCKGGKSRCGGLAPICADPTKFQSGAQWQSDQPTCAEYDSMIMGKDCDATVNDGRCLESPAKQDVEFPEYETKEECSAAGKWWEPPLLVKEVLLDIAAVCCDGTESRCGKVTPMCLKPSDFKPDGKPRLDHLPGTCAELLYHTKGECHDNAMPARCQEAFFKDNERHPQYKTREACTAAEKYWKEGETVGQVLKYVSEDCCGGAPTRCGYMESMCADPNDFVPHGDADYEGTLMKCDHLEAFVMGKCDKKVEPDHCQEAENTAYARLPKHTNKTACLAAGKYWAKSRSVKDVVSRNALTCCHGRTGPSFDLMTKCGPIQSMCADPEEFRGQYEDCFNLQARLSAKCNSFLEPDVCMDMSGKRAPVLDPSQNIDQTYHDQKSCKAAGMLWASSPRVWQEQMTQSKRCCGGTKPRCKVPSNLHNVTMMEPQKHLRHRPLNVQRLKKKSLPAIAKKKGDL